MSTRATNGPDLILHHGRFTTLDRRNPQAQAVAIKDGVFAAVGTDDEILPLAGDATRKIDLHGQSALPGLIDNHLHVIRGGLNFNMELRWDGVPSLCGLRSTCCASRWPARRRPSGCAWWAAGTNSSSPERRGPTLDEINAIAPDTPVFILHLYDSALLNAAALRAVGYTKDTPDPPGGEIQRDKRGNPTGMLIARPNAGLLYATLAKGPKLALGGPAQFDAALHARAEPPRRDERDRRGRRLSGVSG